MSSSVARHSMGVFRGTKSAAATQTEDLRLSADPSRDQPFPLSPDVPDIWIAPATLSDEALIARVCEGDKEALASLFRRYARIVRGVAYRVLRDTSEADDLLQDIFLLIHRKCATFDHSRGPA